MRRRELVQALLAGGSMAALDSCATSGGTLSGAKAVVVGGGYGGATATKYIRMLSENSLGVVLIEPSKSFVSCPMSNLVVGGVRQMADITSAHHGLRNKHGMTVVHDMVSSIDATKKSVKLAGGGEMRYYKLVLSPGIELMFDAAQGLKQANTDGQMLKAGHSLDRRFYPGGPLIPKSGHMANRIAKVAAAAIVAELKGIEINPRPMLTNTCYSFVSPAEVIHVARVHEYVAAEKTFKTIAGSGVVSAARSEL